MFEHFTLVFNIERWSKLNSILAVKRTLWSTWCIQVVFMRKQLGRENVFSTTSFSLNEQKTTETFCRRIEKQIAITAYGYFNPRDDEDAIEIWLINAFRFCQLVNIICILTNESIERNETNIIDTDYFILFRLYTEKKRRFERLTNFLSRWMETLLSLYFPNRLVQTCRNLEVRKKEGEKRNLTNECIFYNLTFIIRRPLCLYNK